jgi:L-idonate 5-dehydrogenase
MQAVVIHAPRDLRVEPFFEPPGELADGQVRVRMAAGGICGSDLHYYHHGGFGTVRVKQPMALGHEASGIVEAVGAGVAGVKPGDLVAVNPSVPCNTCSYCKAGFRNHCENMLFNGSAMRFPHVQGLFREFVDVVAERAVRMPEGTSAELAALCEPFAVCLHAVKQAGNIAGQTVLVSGCGPIGVLTIVAAKLAGAGRIIATDITQHSLDMAIRFGADEAIDVAKGEGLTPFAAGKGTLDVAFECSGAPPAIAAAIMTLRPRGRMVLVGNGGDAAIPASTIVARELSIAGTFRFDPEFNEAAALIGSGRVDLRPLVSATYPMQEAVAAFTHASDRTRATKVVLSLVP